MNRGTTTHGGARLSIDEFRRIPDNEAGRSELVRGLVVREPPPGAEHGHVGLNVALALAQHARRHDLGLVVSLETGFVLETDPPTVRAPDVAFISKERLPADGIPVGYWPFPPDLAIEVVSPSDQAESIDEKALDYLRCGVREVWVVHPRSRRVTIYRSRRDVHTLTEDAELDGGDLVPGFRVRVGDLLA
jgi:Uma2 family endonuclease